jgi:hypothetical protein
LLKRHYHSPRGGLKEPLKQLDFTYVALWQAPEILNPIDVVTFSIKEAGVDNPKVMETRYE